MLVKTLHLTVLIGFAGETPSQTLSRDVLDALTSVSVQVQAEGRTGFQLAFETDRRRVADELLRVFQFGLSPVVRVVIVVTIGGAPTVLCDGIVTQHQNAPSPSGKTTLTFTGEDLSVLMDLIDRTGSPLAGINDYTQVNALLAPYAAHGVLPAVVPSPDSDFSDPSDGTPLQDGTDYSFISSAARKVGYVFYLEPGPVPGLNKAYWGPEVELSQPQPALTLGAGLHNNVTALSFTHATQQKALPLITIKVGPSVVTIPLPDQNPLRPPLTAAPQPPVRINRLIDDHDGKLSVGRALARGIALAARTGDNVSGSGSLDVRDYGRLLQARRLVAVRGAGLSYDGVYYVNRVSTEIRRGKCTQSFSMRRSGAFPTSGSVPV